MAILVTGDTHGSFTRFSSDNFPMGRELTKEDYVIIAGDFGGIWDYKGENKREEYWLNWLNEKPWTTLFIGGNHENYTRLEALPTAEWNEGKVSFVRPSVIYLHHGQVFDLEGKKILTLRGANSHDIQHGILDPANYKDKKELQEACMAIENEHGGRLAMYRIKNRSWWEHEIPTIEEKAEAFKNMAINNFKVDYVISHEVPSSIVPFVSIYNATEYSKELENIRQCLDYQHWFTGHYHINRLINEKHTALFGSIRRII